jgi:hypothetical protein
LHNRECRSPKKEKKYRSNKQARNMPVWRLVINNFCIENNTFYIFLTLTTQVPMYFFYIGLP